jgi:hypothetical protein
LAAGKHGGHRAVMLVAPWMPDRVDTVEDAVKSSSSNLSLHLSVIEAKPA